MKGFNQQPRVDYHDTFSLVVKPTIAHLILSITVSCEWSLHQLDVNTAFLQGHLFEDVYMAEPPSFVDSNYPFYMCKLHKAIYGLKQTPHAWYHELRQFLIVSDFKNSYVDTSLFTLNTSSHTIYLLDYVDDITITGSNVDVVQSFVVLLAQQFAFKDLGPLNYFLGLQVVLHKHELLFSQHRYI